MWRGGDEEDERVCLTTRRHGMLEIHFIPAPREVYSLVARLSG